MEINLLKQKQRWYQFGKHYFYVNIGKNELYTIIEIRDARNAKRI